MKKILVPLFLCIAVIFKVSPIYAQENTSLENTTSAVIEPRVDILQWILKTENGKMYKRLWNASKNRWETDWILIAG